MEGLDTGKFCHKEQGRLGRLLDGKTPEGATFLDRLKAFLEAFFGAGEGLSKIEVGEFRVLDTVSTRVHEEWGCHQMHAGEIVHEILPQVRLGREYRDAFAVIAVTMEDLYPRDSWNFVFGLAEMSGRNGVFR